jgi:2-hydroxychromene-2-carboxylate isomerase
MIAVPPSAAAPQTAPVSFFFDFISPYAYLASRRVEAIAACHGRAVVWRPFRLGVAVVKVMGLTPVMQTPLKSDYVRHDVRRLARMLGEPFAGVDNPDPLPPARAMFAAPAALAGAFAKAMLYAQWAEGRQLGNPEVVIDVALRVGVDAELVAAAMEDPRTRERLNDNTREAVALGVFGSPTCVVGDELFWGVDRLWMLDRYLAAGERIAALDSPPDAALGLVVRNI